MVLLIFFGAIFFVYLTYQKIIDLKGRIYPNVYINNKDFSGKTPEAVFNYFQNKNRQLSKIKFFIFYNQINGEPIATFSASQLRLRYDAKGLAERAAMIGRGADLTAKWYERLSAIYNLDRFDLYGSIDYDKREIKEFLLVAEDRYNKPAKNALFTFKNGRVVNFRKEEKGERVLREDFLKEFDQKINSLEQRVTDKKVVLLTKEVIPEITLSQANDFGIKELIGQGKSDFSHSIPGRIDNIILAASKFNGVLIAKGKILSFNQTIGDVSSLTGYKPSYIIKNGKTILGDGGGVCQVSTTLFRAALNAGLPIIERHPHSYRVAYYEKDSKPGFDATVFAPRVDLKIKNDTPAYILIQTEVDKAKNLVYFRLYGQKDGRQIYISPVSVYGVQPPPPPLYQDDPTLKKGVIRQIDFAAWGAKAVFTYKVTKEKKVLFEKKFFSSYRPWQAVYLVGIGE